MAQSNRPRLRAHLMSRVQAELILGCDPRKLPELRQVRNLTGWHEPMFIRKEVVAMARNLARERKAKAD